MRILIVGAGIGGTTLAHWLQRAGHHPTLLESASRLRTGGYLIDFWGTGFDVAQQMGIVPRLRREGYQLTEVRDVADDGHIRASLDARRFAAETNGRYVSILRGDLAAAIYESLEPGIETIFGDSVASLDDDGTRVRVDFEHAAPRNFDLVIGADGLHSRIRELAFGPAADFERELGMAVAAFDVTGYRPRDELVAVMHAEPGAQMIRAALRGDKTMFMVTFRHTGPLPLDDRAGQEALLRRKLAGARWEIPAILDRIPGAHTFFLDRASQIRMPAWTSGRIGLIGDAAACPSLLAGQGSALAMVAAFTLAAELARTPADHRSAFAEYERRLMPMLATKQDAARGLGIVFAPKNRRELLLRSAGMRLMNIPLLAGLMLGRSLRDPAELPEWPGR